MSGITGVEVRWVVVSKEHEDGDSVELADSRHLETVRTRCDTFDNGPGSVRWESDWCSLTQTWFVPAREGHSPRLIQITLAQAA